MKQKQKEEKQKQKEQREKERELEREKKEKEKKEKKRRKNGKIKEKEKKDKEKSSQLKGTGNNVKDTLIVGVIQKSSIGNQKEVGTGDASTSKTLQSKKKQTAKQLNSKDTSKQKSHFTNQLKIKLEITTFNLKMLSKT